MSDQQYDQLLVDEGKAVQSALHSYFLKKKESKEFNVSFLDISTINARLVKSGLDNKNIDSYTPRELAELLEVDGVITGVLKTSKPMSDGASLALGVLVGFYGATNAGKCTINIHDGGTGALLWKYDKTLSRGLGSDTNTMINAIMRKVSRKFPYNDL